MPTLIPLVTADVPSYPSRAAGRTAAKNRRAMLKSAIWPLVRRVYAGGRASGCN